MDEINDEKLKKDLTFDHFGRYAIMRDIIDVNRLKGQSFRVLDVGGRGNFLRLFLEKDDVYYLDPLVDSDDKNYIEGDGCNIPLDDGSFDWVVSSDVFEHIPLELREKFLSESIRVAKNGVILAAPFYSKEVNDAEVSANESFKIIADGENHPWLHEHIINGLPEEKLVEDYLQGKYDYQKISNNDLMLWHLLIGILFNIKEKNFKFVSQELGEFNYYYNTELFPIDRFSGEVLSYRKIYFIKKSADLISLNTQEELHESTKIVIIEKALNLLNLASVRSANRFIQLEKQLEKAKEIITFIDSDLKKWQDMYRKSQEESFRIKNSLSWKIAKPVRWVKNIYKKYGKR
jgi:O-antigen biosynthesis protein